MWNEIWIKLNNSFFYKDNNSGEICGVWIIQIIFHLLFGILFTFHLQYTNLWGWEEVIYGALTALRIHHPRNVRYLCRDLIYLLRGIRSINEKLYRDDWWQISVIHQDYRRLFTHAIWWLLGNIEIVPMQQLYFVITENEM